MAAEKVPKPNGGGVVVEYLSTAISIMLIQCPGNLNFRGGAMLITCFPRGKPNRRGGGGGVKISAISELTFGGVY